MKIPFAPYPISQNPEYFSADVTTLFKNPEAFHQLISDMAEELKDKRWTWWSGRRRAAS